MSPRQKYSSFPSIRTTCETTCYYCETRDANKWKFFGENKANEKCIIDSKIE